MGQVNSYSVNLAFTVSSLVDITADVEEITIDRELGTFRNKLGAGQATIKLNNCYGRYTPTNSLSDLTLAPFLAINIDGVASGGSSVPLFRGTIDSYDVTVGLPDPQQATFKLSDTGKLLTNLEVCTPLQTVQSGSIVQSCFVDVLLQAGLTTSQISVDAINERRGYMGFNHVKATDAINELIATGPYAGYVGRGGVVTIKGRYFGASQTPVATLTEFYNFSYSFSDEFVINHATFSSMPGSLSTASTHILVNCDADLVIGANSTAAYYLDYYDDSTATSQGTWGNPTNMSEFKAHSGPAGTGTNVASQGVILSPTYFVGTVLVSLSNSNAFPVYVNGVQFQGSYIRFNSASSIYLLAVDNSSQIVYGTRNVDIKSNNFGVVSAMLACAQDMITGYKNPRPKIQVSVRNQFPWLMGIELGNNLAIVNSLAGVSGNYTILKISETITAATEGWIHEAQFDVEPTWDWFILDSQVAGILNGDRLGSP